jgi:hypothetical protein
MAQELIGWLLIGSVALAVMGKTGPPKMLVGRSAEDEVDPTRWRHDGAQPVAYKDGNQAPVLDKQVEQLLLAF